MFPDIALLYHLIDELVLKLIIYLDYFEVFAFFYPRMMWLLSELATSLWGRQNLFTELAPVLRGTFVVLSGA